MAAAARSRGGDGRSAAYGEKRDAERERAAAAYGEEGDAERGRGEPRTARSGTQSVGGGGAAYGEEGACRGVSARSGWRVNAPSLFK
ncbi:hypothetical protein SLITK23_22890 [Streptomyces lividans]|nr:hypothetical protein SLITK23_22890 [Streptomyces lividans]